MKIDNLGRTQNRALMRLLLRVQAETHRLLLALGADIERIVNQAVGADGLVDGVALTGKLPEVDRAFEVAMAEWEILFEFAREQAASIPFGGLVVAHNHFMRGLDQPTANRTIDSRDVDAVVALWQGRRDRALRAAALRIEGDGLQLSQRIWRLKSNGLERIRSTLLTAMAERTSARELAKLLAPVLGAGQGCPRWSMHRLYGMTAGERATSKKGLFSGNECSGQGIAYNALRLARTELQYAHHAMTSEIYANSPWVEGKWVRLSPAHPKIDVCDSYAAGGPYEASEQILPLHPNCVTPGQRVQTERGNVPIEQVHGGDRVLTHLGRYRKVVKAWSRECNETVYTITTDKGHFELTGEHPVLLWGRGWVEAKSVQVGEQVLYALVGTILDSQLVKSEDTPALLNEPRIPASIMIGAGSVPPSAVTFNTNLDGGQGEINVIAMHPVFSLIGNTSIVKRFYHSDFQRRGIGEPIVSLGLQHGKQSGITFSLGARNFFADIGTFCRVIVTRKINAFHRFLHLFADKLTASTVVFFPTGGNSIATVAQGDIAFFQQGTEHSVGETIPAKYIGTAETLPYVDILQKIKNWLFVLRFKAKCVPFGDGQSVGTAMLVGNASKLSAANGASNHDNLLSLSPDSGWGAGSGNPVVSGVMTSAQALTEYTTIRGIEQRNYSGFVYNMEIEGDNSYTVNGAVVHNCMCYYEAALMAADDFRKSVRGWLAGENSFLDEYQLWGGFAPTLQLPLSMGMADALELWLGQDADGHAEALGL